MQLTWYTSCYEPYVANKAASSLSYSSGVFGMRRTSPIWALWRQEVEFLYPAMSVRNEALMHLVPQIALNIVIVRNPLIVRLDPLYNFRCDVPGALRVGSGRVVTNLMMPPRGNRRHPFGQLGHDATDLPGAESCSIAPATIFRLRNAARIAS